MTDVTQEDIDYHRINSRLRPLEEIGYLCTKIGIDLIVDSEDFDCSARSTISISNFLRNSGCSNKLKYIKSGTTGHTFCVTWSHPENEKCSIPLAIKVVGYPKNKNYGDVDNNSRPENAEIRMLCILSDLVINGECEHIVLPFVAFKSPLGVFSSYKIPDSVDSYSVEKYVKFTEKIKENKFHENSSILISEWCNGGDLSSFIKRHKGKISEEAWRSVFFQIVFTLAKIQEKYPSFRHNDLKPNNILMNIFRKKSTESRKYALNGKTYTMPCPGFMIKIWDFDFASIDGKVDNVKLCQSWTKKMKIVKDQHRYYDLHYFFNTLSNRAFYPHLLEPGGASHKVQKFVRRVVPLKYAKNKQYVQGRTNRLCVVEEYTTPEIILENDPFFAPFRSSAN